MEPECSLSHLQDHETCPCSHPDQFTPRPPSNFLKICSNIIFSCMPGSSRWSLSLWFPHQNPVYNSPLPSPIRPICPAHFILLNLITQIIFGEEHRLLSSSLHSLFHSPVTLSLLGPNILLSTLFSNTLSLRCGLVVCDQVLHPTIHNNRQNQSSVNLNLYAFRQQIGRQTFCIEW